MGRERGRGRENCARGGDSVGRRMDDAQKGNTLFVQGQYSESIKFYTKVLKDNASPVLLWYDVLNTSHHKHTRTHVNIS
jgi:hypothetical protein